MQQNIFMIGEMLKDPRGIKYILRNILKSCEMLKNILDTYFDAYKSQKMEVVFYGSNYHL